MREKRIMVFLSFIMLIALLQTACTLPFSFPTLQHEEPVTSEEGSSILPNEENQEGGQNVASGPPTPTPFVYSGPAPAAGTGGVYGRLLWNDEPIAGVQGKLCEEIQFFGGCSGLEYPTMTDNYGVYVINNVPPRNYGLTYQGVDSDTWFYVTSFVLDAQDFEVKSGEMVNMGDFNTIRTDLLVLTPTEDEHVTVTRPTLSWQAYPDAAYYELTFHSGRGGSLIHRKTLTENNFIMDRDLQNCDYSFKIEVFNASGTQIAENDGWRNFIVGGMEQSCKLIPLGPADGATVSATGLTLSWEPHAWADVYKIHFYDANDSNKKILDFVETRETSYTITQNVPAGSYIWVVYAYDSFGDGLGFSDQFTLYVTNP
jgi:hypothetical protein